MIVLHVQVPHKPGINVIIIPSLQTQKLVDEGNIEAARKEFQVSFTCRMLAWVWASVVAPLLITAVTLTLVLGIVLNV